MKKLLNLIKKIPRGFILTVVVVFGTIVGLSFVLSFYQPVAKNYACKKYSVECELEKDRIVFIPIEYDSTLTDALGFQINREKFQWYVASTKVKQIIPTTFSIQVGGDFNTGPVYEDFPSPQQVIEHSEAKIDTVDISNVIPGVTKAAVLVSGPHEFILDRSSSLNIEIAFGKKK
ncbi:hypothetical protein IT400_01675 [Candidatus Nomurabacteria bacterium]|nr:hypothetical protein [Candidatus Nomurabacteria bacterium]